MFAEKFVAWNAPKYEAVTLYPGVSCKNFSESLINEFIHVGAAKNMEKLKLMLYRSFYLELLLFLRVEWLWKLQCMLLQIRSNSLLSSFPAGSIASNSEKKLNVTLMEMNNEHKI